MTRIRHKEIQYPDSANPYRDIFFIPCARHDTPFRVTTDDSLWPTLEDACRHRDHYEANRDEIEAARKAETAEKEARRELKRQSDIARDERKMYESVNRQAFRSDIAFDYWNEAHTEVYA